VEQPKTLGPLSISGKILAAFFQSVTPRTAGFATINHGYATLPTLLITMLLMFIGGSPGGTAGGIKTTTFFSVFQYIKAVLTGSSRVHVAHRTIKWSILDTANAILILNMTIAVISIVLLSVFEPALHLHQIAFEVFSALGTVGLTTGITPNLSVASKIVLILTMFCGPCGCVHHPYRLHIQTRATKLHLPRRGYNCRVTNKEVILWQRKA